ncbi:MAG: restriction endonuclease, partial [Clostridia bacterium]|nr:restriction endonuclease [Clostridia bacterium]
MDFKDKIKEIGERVLKLKDKTQTEEATKMAFIVPFMQALGYDVFNPEEITPEYITDIATKKGEKIDYAILKDGVPGILIECKHHEEVLDVHQGQL